MARRPSSGILVVAAVLWCLPGIFLVFYQQTFRHPALIIVFGIALVLLAFATIGLVAIGMELLRPSHPDTMSVRFFGIACAVLFSGLAFIYAGAYISNSVWGDTLNYSIVATFAFHSSVVVDFLPVSPERKTMVFWGIVAAGALLLLLIFVIALKTSSRVAAQLQTFLQDPEHRRRRIVSLSSKLALTVVISAGVCVGLAARGLPSLYGEPISAFLQLVPASTLLGYDNARLAASIEDRHSRATYKKSVAITPKHVILIMVDALRADRMGVYGYGRRTTPFLSELFAKKPLHRVEMALSTCPESYCGVASTLASRPFHQISADNFKLHELLRDQGYRTNFFLTGNHRYWSYLWDFYGGDVDAVYDFDTLRARDMHDDRNVLTALETIAPAGAQPNFFSSS